MDLSKYRIHDLSMTYDGSIAGYSEKMARSLEVDGWNAKWLTIYSHAGTHMDAPAHFGVSNKTIDDFKPRDSIGPAWVVNLSINRDQQLIKVKDLGDVRERFQSGESLLFRSGWSNYIKEPRYRDGLPRISVELAQWCVDQGVRMVGVEPPSVADVNNLREVTEIHHILLGGDVIILEGLHNLTDIKSEQVLLMAFPIKTTRGDGAPARVLAFEEIP